MSEKSSWELVPFRCLHIMHVHMNVFQHVHKVRLQPADSRKEVEDSIARTLEELPAPWRETPLESLVEPALRFLTERPVYAQKTDGSIISRSEPVVIAAPPLEPPLVVIFDTVFRPRARDDGAPFYVRLIYDQLADDSDAYIADLYEEIQAAECEARAGLDEYGGEKWTWNPAVHEVWSSPVQLTWKFLSQRECTRFQELVQESFARRGRACQFK